MSDEPVSLSLEVLKEIRDEVRGVRDEVQGVRDEVQGVGKRVDETNQRLDATNQRIVESEIRTATAITELAGNVKDLTTLLRLQGDIRPRVEQCEKDIIEIRSRLS